jgi:hypothetical protein
MIERVGSVPGVAETSSWRVEAAALSQAVDAASAGKPGASAPLAAAGFDEAAAAFAAHFGSSTTRYALAALRNLQSGRADGRGIVLMRGTGAIWCATEVSGQPDMVDVGPVDTEGLRAALSSLVGHVS